MNWHCAAVHVWRVVRPKLMTQQVVLAVLAASCWCQCAVGLITGQVSPRQWIRVSFAKQAAYINPHSYSWSSNNQTTSPQVPETKTNWAKLTKEPSFPSTINFYWLSNRISCSYDANCSKQKLQANSPNNKSKQKYKTTTKVFCRINLLLLFIDVAD